MTLRLPDGVRRSVIDHALECLPEEACGLLVGMPGVAFRFEPLENIEHSAVGFTLDPEGHYGVIRRAESAGEMVIGVVHSHTSSDPVPSTRDLAMALDPGWAQVIVGLAGEPDIRAWSVLRGVAREVPISR